MPAPPRLAWIVEIRDMTCVVFATTGAKAQWIATRCYWDAFGRNGWPRAKAARAQVYDRSPLRDQPQKAWGEDHVMDTMPAPPHGASPMS